MTHLTATLEEFKQFTKQNHLITNNTKLLDVGCRYNINKNFFKQLGIEWEGIDMMPQDDDVKEMNMVNLSKLQDNYYDFVFICHALEHCYNPFGALYEAKEVLKDGGWLFLSLPCYCDFHLEEIDHIFCFTQKQIGKLVKFIQYVDVQVYKGTNGGYDDKNLYNLICVGKKDINTNTNVYHSEYILYPADGRTTTLPNGSVWQEPLRLNIRI